MRFLNQKHSRDVYFKGIIPSVLYCIAIWGSCTKVNMDKINSIHLKAARFIERLKKSVPDCDVLYLAKWKSIPWYYKRRSMCITHKLFYGNDPNKNLIERKPINRNLRNILQIKKRQFNYVKYKNSFSYRSPSIWNKLDNKIKNLDYDLFKKRVSSNITLLENINIYS